jgi:hypothetical protein
MYIGLRVKYPIFLSSCNDGLIFSKRFAQRIQIQNLIKIRPVEAALFYADRRTDGETGMTKLIAHFRNFANAPKIDTIKLIKL